MTNFERLKNELRVEDIGGCAAIHRLRNEETCLNRNCDACFEWLKKENIEPVVLTPTEKIILKNVDSSYKYIARDEDGSLYLYETEPTCKYLSFWQCEECLIAVDFYMFNHLFKFVRWEDEKAYSISDLIKGV